MTNLELTEFTVLKFLAVQSPGTFHNISPVLIELKIPAGEKMLALRKMNGKTVLVSGWERLARDECAVVRGKLIDGRWHSRYLELSALAESDLRPALSSIDLTQYPNLAQAIPKREKTVWYIKKLAINWNKYKIWAKIALMLGILWTMIEIWDRFKHYFGR